MNEEKLKEGIIAILLSYPEGFTNKTIDRLIDLFYRMNDKKRTIPQNNALHVLFQQLSDECLEKGVEMRDLVRDEVPIQCTPANIKWLWKKVQKGLFKKKSTTELKKTGEIEIVYDNFNKLVIERTKGEISLPPFPHNPERQKEHEIQPLPADYPTEGNDPDKIKF